MTKSKRFMLPDISDCAAVHVCRLKRRQQIVLTFAGQFLLKLGRMIEIVFQCAFPAGRYKNKLCDTGGARFINRVLDQRLVNQSHDLFWNRFGGWQETRAQTCNRKDRFCYFTHIGLVPLINALLRSVRSEPTLCSPTNHTSKIKHFCEDPSIVEKTYMFCLRYSSAGCLCAR